MTIEKYKPIGIALVMPFQTQVAVFDSFKSWRKYYKKIGSPIDPKWADGAAALASTHRGSNGKYWYSIIIPEAGNLGTVVHECSHMVDYICDDSGVIDPADAFPGCSAYRTGANLPVIPTS